MSVYSTTQSPSFRLKRPSNDTVINLALDLLRAFFIFWGMVSFFFLIHHNPEAPLYLVVAIWGGQIFIAVMIDWNAPSLKRVKSAPVEPVVERTTIHPSISWSDYPRGEYVYILQDVSCSRFFKIGRTTDLETRLLRFHVTLPIVIHVVHLIPCVSATATETTLHRRFSEQRQRGEWFDLSDEDIAWLKRIKRM